MKDRRCDCSCNPQRHNHEFTGSVRLAELNQDPHNHRFNGISGQAIPKDGTHIHEICTTTDFYEDHFHLIDIKSGPAIPVGGGRHVHFISAETKVEDGHCHEFIVATLIENPIGD